MDVEDTKTLLHAGGPFNARLYRFVGYSGVPMVEKDFSRTPWLWRVTVARRLVDREVRILEALRGTGIVPLNSWKRSALSFYEDFCAGFALRDSCCGACPGNEFDPAAARGVPAAMLRMEIPRSFFEALEAGVHAVHERGWVHLDLHNARNILVGPDFRPVLIDWQSAIRVRRLPGRLRRFLEEIDLAGVYKHWDKFRPGELTADRRLILARQRRLRRFWLPRIHLSR